MSSLHSFIILNLQASHQVNLDYDVVYHSEDRFDIPKTGGRCMIYTSICYPLLPFAASRINWAISFGCDTYDAWLAGSEIVVAFIRCANIR